MARNSHVLKGLLFSTALMAAQATYGQTPPPDPAAGQPAPDQEPAAETAAEGDAKAQGQDAVPTSEALSADDRRSLEDIVVVGQRIYRNRTDTVAPELTYGQEFFQKFEPTSVGDQLKRDRHRARIAVAGGDTIDRTPFTQQTVEKIRPSVNGGAEFMRIGQNDTGRPLRDIDNVLNFQPTIVEFDCTGCGCVLLVSGMHGLSPPWINAKNRKS